MIVRKVFYRRVNRRLAGGLAVVDVKERWEGIFLFGFIPLYMHLLEAAQA